MPLGYGYVKREATDYVNWAEIGKNMSDMLANENKIREEKKAAIDEDSRQIGLYLANAPTGQDANAKTAALKLADDATQYKNLQLKLLKSGKLKLKDYLVNTQNLKDSITQAFDAMTDYQKSFGERMDQYRAGTLSRISVDDMADVEGFGDWQKSGFYVNPTNGVVNVALKDKKVIDGKEIYSMGENPNKVASMNYIRGLINTKVDKADVQKATDEWASKLGKEVKWDKARSYIGNIFRGGKDITIKDITSRQDIDPKTKSIIFDFKNAEDSYINSVLVNPYARGSVLIDYVGTASNGKEYRITNDEADAKANPEAIYRKINPSTQQGELIFSDEQKKASEEYVRNMARSKYNYEEEVQTTSQAQLQQARETKPDENKPKYDAMGAWNDIFKANNAGDKEVAINTILGTQQAKDQGLLNLKVNKQDATHGTITFIYQKAPSRTINFNPSEITLQKWAQLGNEIHGVDDVKSVLKKAGGGDPNARMDERQSNFGEKGIGSERVEQNYGPRISNYVLDNIGDSIKEDSGSNTAANLNNKFSELGYQFKADNSYGITGKTDYIRVSDGTQDEKGNVIWSGKIKIDSDEDIAPAMKQIAAYMAANPNNDLASKKFGPLTSAPTSAPTDEEVKQRIQTY